MTLRAALSLGANLGDRDAALAAAVAALRATPGLRVVAVSPTYDTDPVGGPEQPAYANQVVIVAPGAPPGDPADLLPAPDEAGGRDEHRDPRAVLAWRLLAVARGIEAAGNRVRTVRWGPRTIDVDVLAVADWRSGDPELTVPHPRLAQRAFVLIPWADVDPDFPIPGLGRVADLLAALPPDATAGVRRR